MAVWKIIYYETRNGECPIEDFLNTKSINNKAKIFSLLTLLEEKGPNLPRPYADFLKDGIHELRIKLSGEQTRILYYFCYKQFIVLTHAFNKRTDRVPEIEIKKAIKYKNDFLSRITESQLRERENEDI